MWIPFFDPKCRVLTLVHRREPRKGASPRRTGKGERQGLMGKGALKETGWDTFRGLRGLGHFGGFRCRFFFLCGVDLC